MGIGHVLWQLIACPVEQLGIELPAGGADAVSHEDLRRDTRLLLGPDPAGTFVERLGQMQMAPVPATGELPEGTTCAARGEGKAPAEQPRLIVATWPATADEATAGAALISIAKAWDLEGGPKGRATLCLLPRDLAGWAPPEPKPAALRLPVSTVDSAPKLGVYLPYMIGGGLWIGPIAAGELTLSNGRFEAGPVDPARPPEKINYTDVQARTKAIFLRL